MTPETPTPRTDAMEESDSRKFDYDDVPIECYQLMSAYARRLERELVELRKNASELIASLQTETDSVERELAAERALADKLLAITEKAVSDHEGTLLCVERCKCSGRRIVNDNAEALASWREARK